MSVPADVKTVHERQFPWLETPDERYPSPNPEGFTEFDKKYPPDSFGEAACPNARVWRVYRDRVTLLDEDLLDGWHKTLDVLLIFTMPDWPFPGGYNGFYYRKARLHLSAGTNRRLMPIRFSSKRLQPDYGEIAAKGILAMLAEVNGTYKALPMPSFDRAEMSARTHWINGLWFASLTIGLVDALLSIMAKQWLVEYASKQRQPAISGQHWAWRHYAFHNGLDRWGVGVFISSLSVLLYISLYLFLFGLLVFLFELDAFLCTASLVLTVGVGTFHLASTFAPLWYGDCPTTTPILTYFRWFACAFEHNTHSLGFKLRPAAYDGSQIILGNIPHRNATILRWMITNLLTDADVSIALDAIGCLDRAAHEEFQWTDDDPLEPSVIGPIVECRLRTLLRSSEHCQDIIRLKQSSALRTLVFLRWQLPEDLRSRLPTIMPERTNDLSVLASIMWRRGLYMKQMPTALAGEKCMVKIGRWYSSHPNGPDPMHDLTRRNLLLDIKAAYNADVDWFLSSLDVLCIYGLLMAAYRDSFSSQHFQFALRVVSEWALRRVELQNPELVTKWRAEPAGEVDASVWSVLLPWAYLQTNGAKVPNFDLASCQRIYSFILTLPPLPTWDEPWMLHELVSGLGCTMLTEDQRRQHWEPPAMLLARRMLRDALQSTYNQDIVWSSKLHDILCGLLTHCRNRIADERPLAHVSSDSLSRFQAGDHHHFYVLTKLREHSGRGQFLAETAINVLRRLCVTDGHSQSVWEMAFHIHGMDLESFTNTAALFSVELAILSQSSCADILRPDVDLGQLLDALAGGDRGVKLALANVHDFVIVARHARTFATGWWENVKAQLLNLPCDQWDRKSDTTYQSCRYTLIEEVESGRDCDDCVAVLQEMRQTNTAAAYAECPPVPQGNIQEASTNGEVIVPAEPRGSTDAPKSMPTKTLLAASACHLHQFVDGIRIAIRRSPTVQSADIEMQSHGARDDDPHATDTVPLV
ncbi:hypothetical protein BKA62DRAFT_760037 [Auriculariales sp. MPI-PUGE-AT-0066]|nr:hypothetical protein BKA62DRAFT_760037 [Auriculariales sp. MPI-PUGE-AT-0066]